MLVLAHPAVVDRLLESESAALGALQSAAGRAVRLQVEALYGVDQFDVVAL